MTVAKSHRQATVDDLKTRPKAPHSSPLTEAEEAAVTAFRRRTLLRPDDYVYALQLSIPHLTQSALHRSLQRHGISRLPDIQGDKPKRQRVNYPINFFHMDIAKRSDRKQGSPELVERLYLFVGIDHTSKYALTQLVDGADRRSAWKFLEHQPKAVPFRIYIILTDSGIQFAEQPRH